ncbi:FLYWCH-type zinc finger-containing protein 1 [Microcaecilia unicolor]|uniref:Uncharacterized protein LOC115478996 n=1 Tax=Microcaecilia unicolor TaxID=1415580 RepID=A0A6P7Z564_9AMPH|nr:uncharacterized protein LOC115478996 [Microcaecilia unicolor]
MMEFVESQKGKTILLKDGYRYRKVRINVDGSVSWLCLENFCKGRIRLQGETVFIVSEHNHAPDVSKNEALRSVVEMRRRAEHGMEKPMQIIQQCTNGISLESAVHLPAYVALQRAIERRRRRVCHPYVDPRSVGEIDIPSGLCSTFRKSNFLLWDSGVGDDNRILMFGTMENLQILEENNHWFIDGTFKISPELFFQVFSIHALVDKSALPLVYVLMMDKKEETYVRVFRKLVELNGNLNPVSVLADFEKASQNAVTKVFPGSCLSACLFHLGQCLWRKVQDCGLSELYRSSEDVRISLKMLLALSFLPIEDVSVGFECIVENCCSELTPVTDYWEDTFIGCQRQKRRVEPCYPISVWNVCNRVMDGLPRTNNSVEAWHRSFQQTVDCHHPSIFKLVDHFRREQDRTEIEISRYLAGFRHPECSKSKYVQLDKRLRALVSTYNVDDIVMFLKNVAVNLTI